MSAELLHRNAVWHCSHEALLFLPSCANFAEVPFERCPPACRQGTHSPEVAKGRRRRICQVAVRWHSSCRVVGFRHL